MRRVLATLLTMAVCIAVLQAAPRPNDPGSSQAPTSQTAKKSATKKHSYQVGIASWYGRAFHGRKTASGETYNMYQLTAAHRTLPLGTWLKVTNLENGRTVVVRVNDRGPIYKSRIIDLSYEAATLLGLRAQGIQSVRLDVLPAPPVVASSQNGDYRASFGN